jgi:asparagine synthase (glutamine-hydrolysing)
MCGIAGIIVDDPSHLAPADLSLLGRALRHRGPDGEGQWISADGRVGLVHRRLAIIDTSALGDQPMHSSDCRYTIVYNGEIFNFVELRDQLRASGVTFRGESDTEVVLEAWRAWGPDMLLKFNGMWAFVLVDNQSGETFLARDRFGVKPLHYLHTPRVFAFASELRALRALPQAEGGLSHRIAARLLFDPFSIEGSDQTLFEGIHRLPAGHCASLVKDRLTVSRWWRTTDHLVDPPANDKLAAERFRELFYDAINLRMRSDVPVGTCLSGGFDSSAIVGGMMHVAGRRNAAMHDATDWRHAFIASFPGQPNDETPEATEAAAYAGVTPHLMMVKDDDALSDIESVLADLDDVYISLPTAPWQIYRELRRSRVTVSLDGHGADELMGAYRQQGASIGFQLRNHLARMTGRSRTIAAAVDSAKAAWLSGKGLNFVRGHRFTAPEGPPIASDDDALPPEWGAMNRRLYRMFHATVLPTILRNFDRLSMAHGVEVRMPFMDWRLVTYVMSLPDSAKSANGYSKWVARAAMKDQMPERIRMGKRKVGFNSPMPGWLNGPLRPWVRELLERPNDAFDALVDTKALCARVQAIGSSQQWDWHTVGRLWPYINLKWLMDGNTR